MSTHRAEALLASADVLSREALRLVLARADYGRLLSLPAIHAALGRGRSGSPTVRAALESHLPQLALCASPLEVDFVLLCERYGIEIPEPNPRIGRYRPDMLWRRSLLIVELDGKEAHSSPAQIAAGRSRQGALEGLGYTVLRFTWADVHHSPEQVAAAVRSAMIR